MSIREVMDFPNYNQIFGGGKMEKKKMNLREKIDILKLMKTNIETLIDFHEKLHSNSIVRKTIENDIDELWQKIKKGR